MPPATPVPPPPTLPDPEPGPTTVPRWLIPAVVGMVVVSAIVVVVLLVSQAAPEPGRYSGHGISFEYPPDWDPLPDQEASVAPGSGEPAFAIRVGLEPPLDVVFLTRFDMDQLPPGSTVEARLQQALEAFAEASGLEVLDPIAPFDAPTVEAYAARLRGALDETSFESLVFYLVDGDALWVVSCQSTAPHRVEMESGCRRIVRTFHSGA